MKTTTKDEALEVLKQHRARLIATARAYAVRLALLNGDVHSQAVREAMRKDGHLDGYTGTDHWLGPVFHKGPFEQTGRFEMVQSEKIHRRPLPLWRLKVDANEAMRRFPTPAPAKREVAA